jgi:hypothetical protein
MKSKGKGKLKRNNSKNFSNQKSDKKSNPVSKLHFKIWLLDWNPNELNESFSGKVWITLREVEDKGKTIGIQNECSKGKIWVITVIYNFLANGKKKIRKFNASVKFYPNSMKKKTNWSRHCNTANNFNRQARRSIKKFRVYLLMNLENDLGVVLDLKAENLTLIHPIITFSWV